MTTTITISKESIIEYLQSELNYYKGYEKFFGPEDERTQWHMAQLIGAKELAEMLINEQINLQKDGKVTTGF